MKKLLLGFASAIAMIGLAACSDTDETTTQAVPGGEVQPLDQTPDAVPPVPGEPVTPSVAPPAE